MPFLVVEDPTTEQKYAFKVTDFESSTIKDKIIECCEMFYIDIEFTKKQGVDLFIWYYLATENTFEDREEIDWDFGNDTKKFSKCDRMYISNL